MSFSGRVYGMLLLAYQREFRRRYGSQMQHLLTFVGYAFLENVTYH